EFVLDERPDDLVQHAASFHTTARRKDRLFRRGEGEKGVGGRDGHLQFRDVDFGGGAVADRLGGLDVGFAQAEIDRLPGDEGAERGTPYAAQRVRPQDWSGHRGNYRLGEQQAKDIVVGRAIELSDEVGARE